MSKGRFPIALIVGLVLCIMPVLGVASKPFVVTDSETGNPEAVWSNQPQGQSTAEILYSYLIGSSWAPSTSLSTIGRPDVTPVLAFDETGGRIVAWETAETIDRILLRTLPASGGSWNPQ